MELTLDEKLECILLHPNDNLSLHAISKEREIEVARLKYYIELYKNGEKCEMETIYWSSIYKDIKAFTKE